MALFPPQKSELLTPTHPPPPRFDGGIALRQQHYSPPAPSISVILTTYPLYFSKNFKHLCLMFDKQTEKKPHQTPGGANWVLAMTLGESNGAIACNTAETQYILAPPGPQPASRKDKCSNTCLTSIQKSYQRRRPPSLRIKPRPLKNSTPRSTRRTGSNPWALPTPKPRCLSWKNNTPARHSRR